MRILMLVAAIIAGMVISIMLFQPYAGPVIAAAMIERTHIHVHAIQDIAKGLQYSGVVYASDVTRNTLVLAMPSSYPLSDQSPTMVRFSYDKDTLWNSTEYAFNGNVLEQRNTEATAPRDLPNGTLVTLVLDPESTSNLRAMNIVYLRRTVI